MRHLITTTFFFLFVSALHAQYVGIGTATPQAPLHVTNGSVIFTSSGGASATPTSTGLGVGRRMMWYADKAAFRTGYASNTNRDWDMDSIGNYSASFGYNNKAKGFASFAAGQINNVSGDFSGAVGYQCRALGLNSFAAGYQADAMGDYSMAFGHDAIALGNYSFASGFQTTAVGNFSTATGQNNRAEGANSTASGIGLIARAFGSTVVGCYNKLILGGTGEQSLGYNSPIFIVGNGSENADRSNALVIRRQGNVGIGTDDPVTSLQVMLGTDASLDPASGYFVVGPTVNTNIVIDNNEIMARNNGATATLYLQNDGGDLAVGGNAFKPGGGSWGATSDARLKQDVQPYTDGIRQLQNINPVYYHYNQQSGYDTAQRHIGVIAQELQQVAPYMVNRFKKDDNEYLNVDNSAMTYMLINAVKEQQKEIEELKELVKKLLLKQE